VVIMAVLSDFDFLILPGRGNSGPNHWQTHWLGTLSNASRVLQANWDCPDPKSWVDRVETAVASAPRPVVLIAHSLAAITVVKWAATAPADSVVKVAAAFLVATTDVGNADPSFEIVRPFAPIPLRRIPFRTLVVASRNDPRVSFAQSEIFAKAWGADLADAGELGHMGNDANLGIWPTGLLLLGQLLERANLK
jgi:serine hydrolase